MLIYVKNSLEKGWEECHSTVHNIIKQFNKSRGIFAQMARTQKGLKDCQSSIAHKNYMEKWLFWKCHNTVTFANTLNLPYVNLVQMQKQCVWTWVQLGQVTTQWKHVLWSDGSVFHILCEVWNISYKGYILCHFRAGMSMHFSRNAWTLWRHVWRSEYQY